MNRIFSFWTVLSLCAPLAGCGILYTNVRVPRAYRSATPAEVKSAPSDPAVSGKACSRSLLFLFAWGDAGYARAAEDALSGRPDSILYDVKSDSSLRSYLGLYTQYCTVLTAKAAKP